MAGMVALGICVALVVIFPLWIVAEMEELF